MFDRAKYSRDYQADKIVQKRISFNRNSPDDMTLLAWIELQENFTLYCKDLIRADMYEKQKPKE